MSSAPELRRRLVTAALCVLLLCNSALAQTSRRRQSTPQPQNASAIARSVLPSVVLITMEGGCFGSGFFVTAELVATNGHVLECGGRGTVHLTNAKAFPVLASWTDQQHDLALVKVTGTSARPLPLAQDWPVVGDDIYVVGNPEGLEGTFSRGIVSSLRKDEGLIQFDASISPGSSGGPVVDVQGRVVGVTVASVRQGQNLNFAVPAKFLPALITRARSGAAGDVPVITRPTPLPTLANPIRRQWEAKPDWTLFASDILDDDTVPERLKTLVDAGISPDEKDIQGRAAWHIAAERGQTGLARYLRERKANPDPRDPLGRTPLMLVPLVGAPVYHSLNPWAWVWTASLCPLTPPSDNDHDPTLFLLAWFQHVQAHRAVMRELIEAHADVNAKDDDGYPVLDYATQPLVDFDRLLYATGRVRGAQACELTPAQAPLLQGFRLGMSLSAALANQNLIRLRPADALERDACGRSTLEYNAPPTGPLRAYLGGPPESIDVSHVTLAFIDERLVYLRVTFGRGTKWQEQYTQALAQALGRPVDWHDLGYGDDGSRARLLSCVGWQAIAGFNSAGPYVELHDLSALQLLPPRISEQLRRTRPGNAR